MKLSKPHSLIDAVRHRLTVPVADKIILMIIQALFDEIKERLINLETVYLLDVGKLIPNFEAEAHIVKFALCASFRRGIRIAKEKKHHGKIRIPTRDELRKRKNSVFDR